MIIANCIFYNDWTDDEAFTVVPIRRQPPVNNDESFTVNPIRNIKDNLDNEASK